MPEINIKPLSVNEAWKGRRFKTPKYKTYCRDLTLLLPKSIDIPDGKLEIYLEFHLSSYCADWDNPIKPTQDIICAKYGINDNRFYRAIVNKVDCNKGEEKLIFEINSLKDNRNLAWNF